MQSSQHDSVSGPLAQQIHAAIAEAGGWLSFSRYMALALYSPGLGYYANASRKFGWMPESGSDFVTAPELSPLFGRTLAVQVAQALLASGTDELFEFGAGSGALAEQLLQALDDVGQPVRRYTIIDLSGTLKARQAERLARFGERVHWAHAWPESMQGVVVGNEVLDAMPVQLLHFDGERWHERGVASHTDALGQTGFVYADRDTVLKPPVDTPFISGTVTEVHIQAEAFIRTLAAHLQRGAAFFIDYGFPEAEYYHRQRHGGTLMCHRAHLSDADPLVLVGEKDITAHVNFTGIALAGQDAGLDVAGYTSQGRFLLNCGITDLMQAADLRERAMAQKLLNEHEMGELFKVLAFATAGLDFVPLGFVAGDRMHRL
ncbi:MAG: SAM-dependent methyltransferase [Vitreoscilla sp.]|nr:SAM-dependent methyltransferase [Burkholderiales bacterium]MBP6338015.1 SAM-dependent methyltransferase [Vitreoscilla sp.]MBP6675974.1 SAM-dependent methyltransferase [Vitreoscilla sp.]